ncbi:ABC transporter ATP-binding protein (plasmid) [Tistrella mobilis]|uniref:oligopeptide/dipeptide ABC transporter ATP-binding protein n=1 Tax=Tistrella mobilis TaxID=171437 RepID=UPI003557E160
MTVLLDVQGLHRRFRVPAAADRPAGWLHAVDDVSLTLGRGEALGLVGESGCGKTTLAGLVARLTDPDQGRILFDGQDLARLPARRAAHAPWRRRIQMVFQDPGESLDPRLTAIQAVMRPLRRLNGLTGAAAVTAARRALDRVHLPRSLHDRLPHQLSGGQLARVGIARAIAPGPDLLILDEPTSALDVSIQAVILNLLHDLRAELGLACLFVSHDLNVVRLVTDRVAVMYLGRVIETGPTAEVFDAPAHPYTAGLIAAIPRIPAPGAPPLPRRRLAGEPASPVDPDPHRCRFEGRCPRAAAICRERMPQLAGAGAAVGARQVACHLPLTDPV